MDILKGLLVTLRLAWRLIGTLTIVGAVVGLIVGIAYGHLGLWTMAGAACGFVISWALAYFMLATSSPG